eukprot:7639539-Alexandrium_andersonii.AAC.1
MRLRRPEGRFVGGFGVCAQNGAECTTPELRVPIWRPLLGPLRSSFECLKQCGMFWGRKARQP